MSAALFAVREHTAPASHIREYPGSTVGSQEDVLEIAIKQYTPRDRPSPLPADAITLIACHATAVPKEIYEPLWDELLRRSHSHGFVIRGIWIADTHNHGQSAVLNDGKLGSDHSYMDSARDLLFMVNLFRKDMPRPIVGVGHSFGGSQIIEVALLHPRLFTTLVLLEPGMQLSPIHMGFWTQPAGPAGHAAYKTDVFPTRQAAEHFISTNFAFRSWDPRVRRLMSQYSFRPLPTALHPVLPAHVNQNDPPVTYMTTKHQEVWTMAREDFGVRHDKHGRLIVNRKTHPDRDPDDPGSMFPIYRPEVRSQYFRLPTLRPSVLWFIAEKSHLHHGEMRKAIQSTGIGVGGSGGIPEGRVRQVNLANVGHAFPFVSPSVVADHIASWLGAEMRRFREEEEEWQQERNRRDLRDDLRLNAQWMAVIKPPPEVPTQPAKQADASKL